MSASSSPCISTGTRSLTGALVPQFELSGDSLTLVVAVFGTTISPYLFFWQSSQEVEEEEADPEAGPLLEQPEQAPRELDRIGWDTWVGMGDLQPRRLLHHADHGRRPCMRTARPTSRPSEQAAAALKPIAGDAAFFLFSLGIIGTGLLAVPVLAGSVAYAVGELFGWRDRAGACRRARRAASTA